MLCQVGQLASSKSAMKVEAPELSALITILRSVGPVISTRRSSRSFGCGAIFQSASRIVFRLRQEIGRLPASNSFCRAARAREQLLAARLELAVQLGDELERFRAQDLRELRRDAAANGDVLRLRDGHVHRSIL